MVRINYRRIPLLVCLLVICSAAVATAQPLDVRVVGALAALESAEEKFQAPDRTWFEETRTALRDETARVDEALEANGAEYAAAWKQHLRWPLLTKNLEGSAEVNVDELALVRRWLYSNRKGLEYPFFAELRERADAHLDAAYAFDLYDLESEFRRKIATAREQIQQLGNDPTDANAAALGRTLGWLERTRQLTDEVTAVRKLLSRPNAQVVVAKPLIDRAVALLATQVEQSLPVTDQLEVDNASLLGRSRTVNVRGVATTHGQISMELASNKALADVRLVYRGEIDSRCRAVVGPVTVAMKTMGPVHAVTPVQLSLLGVEVLTTEVDPKVNTRVTSVNASSEVFRRIGKRRVSEPNSRRQMNSRAKFKAATLLQEEMDERVNTVIDDIRAEIQAARSSFDGLQDVVAPVAREGAAPRWAGLQTTADAVIVNAINQRREQFGAVSSCPLDNSADVQVRLHVSFINNMAETIMAGKTFTDKYFMRYGRILQAELPPQLMVHARSVRWAMVAEKPRPLEITIPNPNQFHIVLRMQRVEIGDQQFTGPTIATVDYLLSPNEFDEYRLERDGDVQLDSAMSADAHEFLLGKLSAFFAPVLDAGGVAMPEGGSLSRLRGLEPQGAVADRNWLTIGVNLPDEVLAEWLPVPAR